MCTHVVDVNPVLPVVILEERYRRHPGTKNLVHQGRVIQHFGGGREKGNSISVCEWSVMCFDNVATNRMDVRTMVLRDAGWRCQWKPALRLVNTKELRSDEEWELIPLEV